MWQKTHDVPLMFESKMADSLMNGYLNIERSGAYLISLVVAILLATAIAFHPHTLSKDKDSKGIETSKTMILYAMIGSLVGHTVNVYGSELGFIFFGLGGLMRFRSNMSTSTQTGRLILVTLIGLCCGLRMIHIAGLSTIFAWFLIYFSERKKIYKLQVKGIRAECFSELIELYRYLLKKRKCKIIVEKKNQAKLKASFTFSSTTSLDRDSLEKLFSENTTESDHVSISCSAVDK